MAEMMMSTTLSAPAAPQGTTALSWRRRLPTTLGRWLVAYMTWRMEQAAIATLSAMSNRELKDIRLIRSEIANAASMRSRRLER